MDGKYGHRVNSDGSFVEMAAQNRVSNNPVECANGAVAGGRAGGGHRASFISGGLQPPLVEPLMLARARQHDFDPWPDFLLPHCHGEPFRSTQKR